MKVLSKSFGHLDRANEIFAHSVKSQGVVKHYREAKYDGNMKDLMACTYDVELLRLILLRNPEPVDQCTADVN